jgi:hypothetical protein
VAVVDPGVGTSRRMVYVEIGQHRYVAPDNGLLSLLASRDQPRLLVTLENTAYWLSEPSPTFHGRDIMAPVAAHLARGIDARNLGPLQAALVTLDWQRPQNSAGGIAGEVLYVDSFGNLITNISRDDLAVLGNPASLAVDCGGHEIQGVVPTYGAALDGEVVALFDSQGRLEIAKVGGHAARELHMDAGEPVMVSQP